MRNRRPTLCLDRVNTRPRDRSAHWDLTEFGQWAQQISSGGGYTSLTTNPVHIKVGCGFPVSGTIEITPQSHPLRVVDYGSGMCDATFTVTVNGQTYTFN